MDFLLRALIWLSSIPAKVKVYATLALLVAGIVLAAIIYFTNQGYQRAIDDVIEQNERAVNTADEAAAAVERCLDRGGMPDQSTGECRR